MRLATIDVGTNTALLLISTWENKCLRILHDETAYVRLGEGVDSSGRISDAALNRLEEALDRFSSVAERYEAHEVIVTGTSASRDASNPGKLEEIARRTVGVSYRILSGREEAELSFLGAVGDLRRLEQYLREIHPERPLRPGQTHRATIIDVGGGSTEIVQGTVEDSSVNIEMAESLNLGSVRLTERCFSSLPPSKEEYQRAETWLKECIDEKLRAFDPSGLCIGSSGTAVVLAHVVTGNPDRVKIDEGATTIETTQISRMKRRLSVMSRDQIFALSPEFMQGRADVFTAAVMILDKVFSVVGQDRMVVSCRGVRHGVAIRYFRENGSAE